MARKIKFRMLLIVVLATGVVIAATIARAEPMAPAGQHRGCTPADVRTQPVPGERCALPGR